MPKIRIIAVGQRNFRKNVRFLFSSYAGISPVMFRQIKRWVRNYFGFTRNQVNGFMVLIPAMLLLLFSKPLFEWFDFRNTIVPLTEQTLIDSTLRVWHDEPAVSREDNFKPFNFDPNTVSEEELETLGFAPFIAQRIINYREKGGRFTVKKDLYKIYGIDSTLIARLLPFVQLPAQVVAKVEGARPPEVPMRLDLNTADSVQLKAISGIGPVLSQRIIKFRNSLGGFVKVDQLYEVWGLDSLVVEQIQQVSFVDPDFQVSKININTANETDLSKHPYLSKKIARAIITYRFQHGSFSDIRDLDQIDQLDKDQLEKAKPYLTVK